MWILSRASFLEITAKSSTTRVPLLLAPDSTEREPRVEVEVPEGIRFRETPDTLTVGLLNEIIEYKIVTPKLCFGFGTHVNIV